MKIRARDAECLDGMLAVETAFIAEARQSVRQVVSLDVRHTELQNDASVIYTDTAMDSALERAVSL